MDAEKKALEHLSGSPVPLSAPLSLSVRQDGDANIATLRGSVGIDEAETLKTRLPTLVSSTTPHLILDLSELDFVGSASLAAMVIARKRARECGGQVHIVNPRPAVAHLLGLTHVDRMIPVHPTLQAALKTLRNPSD